MARLQATGEQIFDPMVPGILPYENMYQVQIGDKLFRLSGASLSSDAPSYFTEYFSKRGRANSDAGNSSSLVPGSMLFSPPDESDDSGDVLFIDRSPHVFEMIYRHLQGYFIHIRDEVEYTMLYADAMYYNLPRLRALLKNSDFYYTCIGGESFRVPKSLFWQKGNFPNYFDLTYSAEYADVEHVFISKKLIRPPPQSPPFVNRSPELFKDVLAMLSGASFKLDDEKRQSLIQECRYYRLLHLEQRLIKCQIKWNPTLHCKDIILNLADLKKTGVSLPPPSPASKCPSSDTLCTSSPKSPLEDTAASPPAKKMKLQQEECAMIAYQRPFVDSEAFVLVFQIDIPNTAIQFNKKTKTIHICLANEAAQKFEKVFGSLLLANGIDINSFVRDLPPPHSSSRLLALPACMSLCAFQVNGVKLHNIRTLVEDPQFTVQVLDLSSKYPATVPGLKIHLTRSLWKLGVIRGELMMIALKAEGISGLRELNKTVEFL